MKYISVFTRHNLKLKFKYRYVLIREVYKFCLLTSFGICRVYSKKHVKKERSRERAELAKAWNLLDPLGKGVFN